MATKTTLDTLWRVPDELWVLIAPLLGSEKAPGTVGRPARSSRQIFDGVLYVLRTGCQWRALPRQARNTPARGKSYIPNLLTKIIADLAE